MSKYDLILFDMDGTLSEYKTGSLLDGVQEWFDANPAQQTAIITNQGGVGLRYWMQRDGFGDPSKYPDEIDVLSNIHDTIDKLGRQMPYYVCFAYQSKKGLWSPTPPDVITDSAFWLADHRKPAPGMLLDAMRDFGVTPKQTLMVGDSFEDQDAADAAECNFQWADAFFDRPGLFGNGQPLPQTSE